MPPHGGSESVLLVAGASSEYKVSFEAYVLASTSFGQAALWQSNNGTSPCPLYDWTVRLMFY